MDKSSTVWLELRIWLELKRVKFTCVEWQNKNAVGSCMAGDAP